MSWFFTQKPSPSYVKYSILIPVLRYHRSHTDIMHHFPLHIIFNIHQVIRDTIKVTRLFKATKIVSREHR